MHHALLAFLPEKERATPQVSLCGRPCSSRLHFPSPPPPPASQRPPPPCSAALYLTFVVNCFSEQSWRFAGTASLALLHHSILPVAVARFVSQRHSPPSPLPHVSCNVQLVACVAAPLVGDLLDSASRVPALTTILVTQSTAIMVGAAATMHALRLAFPNAAAAALAGTAGTSALCALPAAAVLQQGWFVVVVVAGAVERLMGLATGVAVEIDWVLVLVGEDRPVLMATAMATLGRVELLCEVAGAFIFGALIATYGPLVCVRACLALAALSFPALLALTALTNHLSHAALSQSIPLEVSPSTERLVPAATAATPDEDTDVAAVPPASATSVAVAFGTSGGATGVLSSLAALEEGPLVSAESVQGGALFPVPMSAASRVVDAAASTVPSKEPARLELSPAIMQRAEFACNITPIPLAASPARVTATAALSPSVSPAEGILWRYTHAVAVSFLPVGAAAGAAISAVGRAAGKGWRVFTQEAVMPASMAYVLLCFNAVLAPGVLMTSFLFHHGSFLCPSHHAHRSIPSSLCVGMGVIGVFSSAGAAMGFAASFVSPALVARLGILQAGSIALLFQATMLALSVLDFSSLPLCPRFLYQGLLMLFLVLLVLSRIGQGVYQIVGCQIIQAVPAASANLFGTTEMALSSLAELAMLSLAIVFHDPKYFGALVLMSFAGVVAAAVLYCSWLAFPDPRLQVLFPAQPKVQWRDVLWGEWARGAAVAPTAAAALVAAIVSGLADPAPAAAEAAPTLLKLLTDATGGVTSGVASSTQALQGIRLPDAAGAANAAAEQANSFAAAVASWVQNIVEQSPIDAATVAASAAASGPASAIQAGADLGRAIQEQGQAGAAAVQQAIAAAAGGVGQAGASAGAAVSAFSGTTIASSPGLTRLGEASSALLQSSDHLTSSLRVSVDSALAQASADPAFLPTTAARLATYLASSLASSASSLVSSFAAKPTAAAIAAGLAALLVKAVVEAVSDAREKGKEIPSTYDPEAIAAYFKLRPARVVARAVWVAAQCSEVLAGLALDYARGEGKQNEQLRAQQTMELITRLGPTAIKIGQALSIRPDIMPPAYIEQLQTLQDRVPSFPSADARRIISDDLGRPAEEVFDGLDKPVAAASLGQVYRARVRATGEDVAVKVQRPEVREDICCDLLLLRALAQVASAIPGVHTDLAEVLDSFSSRFWDELDYQKEGANATRFREDMQRLRNVVVPRVLTDLTSTRVLTTEWVQGEKLSDAETADVSSLVTLALNCYLIQLLETGFLHADPHPGNLLRTADGKLCILDFGFMTEVTEPQRYALVSYISHLLSADYERVAQDLVVLGFVPPDLVDEEKTKSVVPQLARVMSQITQGGGARNINFGQVAEDLSSMAQDYVFVIPSYFALILRAFGTLEGIGLDRDPSYSTLQECYPYIAKRLLTDDSPRARAVLRDFLYGSGDRLDVARVEELTQNFLSFRNLMATSPSASPHLDAVAVDAIASAAAAGATTPDDATAAAGGSAEGSGDAESTGDFRPAVAMAAAGRREGVGATQGAAAAAAAAAAAGAGAGAVAWPGVDEGAGVVDPVAWEVVQTVLAPEGSYVQELVLTEMARTVDAMSREALAALWSALVARTLLPVPAQLQQPGTYPLPLLLPGAVLGMVSGDWRTASLSDDDVEALGTLRRLWTLLAPQLRSMEPVGGPSSPAEALSFFREAAPLMFSVLPGAATTATRFLVMLLQRQLLRLADDLDGGDSVQQWEADPYSLARSIRPFWMPPASPLR
ncbi:unnamed protein product [Closterium sp. NIES-64]|nr:unnamed protein product [Closterium sp. NIES-64]